MDYQVILQFRGDSMSDYDTMVSLENELAEHLGDNADVDGHDSGSGETNVFIQTSDLENTLKTAKAVLESSHLLDRVTVAYRRLHDEIYTVDWPDGFVGHFHRKPDPEGSLADHPRTDLNQALTPRSRSDHLHHHTQGDIELFGARSPRRVTRRGPCGTILTPLSPRRSPSPPHPGRYRTVRCL